MHIHALCVFAWHLLFYDQPQGTRQNHFQEQKFHWGKDPIENIWKELTHSKKINKNLGFKDVNILSATFNHIQSTTGGLCSALTKIIGSLFHPFIPAWSALRAAGWLEPIPALGGGGGGAQLGQTAGSSRDVNKQATSTDINLRLACLEEEVKGIDGEAPYRKNVATAQRKSRLNWELNPWPSCWANIQSAPPVTHFGYIAEITWGRAAPRSVC